MRRLPAGLFASLLVPFAAFSEEVPGGPPRVGSDNCPPAISLTCPSAVTFDTGTTVGANNTVTQLTGGCEGLTSVPGPDVTYSLSNALGFRMAVKVTPAPGYDVAIYILSNTGSACPAGGLNAVTNCVAAMNAGGPGVAETLFAPTNLPVDQYYLFIDSPVASGPASAGNYTVQLLHLCPVELIEYSVE